MATKEEVEEAKRDAQLHLLGLIKKHGAASGSSVKSAYLANLARAYRHIEGGTQPAVFESAE